MRKQDVRVVVAAENPDVRALFRRAALAEAGVEVLGEAENVSAAIDLAQRTTPDVVLLDSSLPYVNRSTLPLSRVGGLDIAQAFAGQLPGGRAVLVTNLEASGSAAQDAPCQFFRQEAGNRVPFTLREICSAQTVQFPVFASIEARPQTGAAAQSLGVEVKEMMPYSNRAMYLGGIGLLTGGATMFTIVFAPVGVVIAAAGACVMLFGLTGKLVNRMSGRSR